jgi:hypothetical protein
MTKTSKKTSRGVAATASRSAKVERPIGKKHQPKNLVEFFRDSPLMEVELDLERDRSPGRDVKL